MILESKLIETYYNKKKYHFGVITSLLFTTLCIIASLFYWDQGALSQLLALNPQSLFKDKQYWRLISSIFTHADFKHLMSNLLMLYFLMYFITTYFGYWLSIGSSLIAGILINFLVILSFENNTSLVGISGVIYYLWGLWFFFYIFIDRTTDFHKRIIKIMGLFLILLVPTTYSPSTSYLAHYLGFLIGALVACTTFVIRKKYFRSFEVISFKVIESFEEEME